MILQHFLWTKANLKSKLQLLAFVLISDFRLPTKITRSSLVRGVVREGKIYPRSAYYEMEFTYSNSNMDGSPYVWTGSIGCRLYRKNLHCW